MPRRERPLERTEDELSRFAADLRALRAQVGTPSYRELGRRAHYSSSTLSDAAGGRKLPTLPVTLAYVRACGGDVEVWARRWRELAAELPDGTEPDAGSPYAGLAAFQTADADRFFGRDRLVEDLLDRLSRRPLVAVFGPSGAGKSSLLRAGLIPRLTGEHVVFTPGAHPLKTYEEHVAGHPPADLVVVVDQFEECFTLCADPAERDAFLSALVRSATGRTRVVLGVRADFYEHCAFHEKLAEAVTDAQVLLGPMHADELREAIVRPAAAVGCVVDTALVTRLVAETAGQPAALPLLSHALLETWRRRSGMRLTLEGYERTGGIEHALARTAEETYESLTGAQQETVRHLCRRLATAEIGAPAVKRRVARDELGDDATEVLDQLAAARLVSLDRDSVELAHEALLRHWPRLRDWLAEDSEGLQLHRRLTRAAVDWVAFDRDPGILYRGARLDDALAWRAENDATLNAVEREFLDAATELRDQERTLDRRRASRRRLVTTVLVALVVLAAAATAYGVSARQQAAEQAALATSQRMVSQGRGFLITDSTEAARLALAAYRIAPTDDARDLVLSAAAGSDRTDFAGAVGTVGDVTLSTDGRLIAFGGAKAVQLWDLPHYRKLATIPGALGTLTLSEDGRWLTVSRPQRTVELYDLDDPTAPALAATFPAAETARIDPTGTVLATRAPGQPTRLLSIDHGVAPPRVRGPAPDGIRQLQRLGPNGVHRPARGPDGLDPRVGVRHDGRPPPHEVDGNRYRGLRFGPRLDGHFGHLRRRAASLVGHDEPPRTPRAAATPVAPERLPAGGVRRGGPHAGGDGPQRDDPGDRRERPAKPAVGGVVGGAHGPDQGDDVPAGPPVVERGVGRDGAALGVELRGGVVPRAPMTARRTWPARSRCSAKPPPAPCRRGSTRGTRTSPASGSAT
ncbi:nSTAND1 domain-containing NTPase [Amycolatopsis solani]|uniref:nSTAND1 domain-containing NTPase n=1 Tax=Amycolatopsis solani TaxID=3028615 RepID=UPI0025B1FC33|nr:XRE family transcriptional regulator [Amycolatopsis sp. MEP2-6]